MLKFLRPYPLLLIAILFLPISLSSFSKENYGDKEPKPRPATPKTSIPPIASLWQAKSTSQSVTNDPIRFDITSNTEQVIVGEEIELSVTARLMNISPNLMFFLPGSNAYTLNMLLPAGFQQTGGNLTEFVTGELAYPGKSEATYTIRGFFTSAVDNACFRLLRSHGQATNQSLFVEKATLCVPVHSAGKVGSARTAATTSSFSWCVEAESGSGGRSVSSSSQASAGQYTGSFGNSSEYMAYTITGVPTSGSYTLHLWYSSWENPLFGLVINGSLQTASASGNSSWSGPFVEKTVVVNLQTGTNSLRIQGTGGGTFNLDRLCVDGGDGGSGCTPPSLSLGTPTCSSTNLYSVSFTAQAGASVSSNAGSIIGNQVINIPVGTNVSIVAGLNGCFTQQNAISPSCNSGGNPSGCGTGNGLTGSYYNNTDLSQNPVATRTDAQVNFIWGDSSPIPGTVNADGFSVRWLGQIEAPVSGNYTFKTNNDDGTRLWINGQQLINDWNGHAPTWQQGSIYLNQGQKYDIKMEFAEFTGGAQAQLYWEYPGQGSQIVPGCRLYSTGATNPNPPLGGGTGSGLTGFYTNSSDLSDYLVAIRTDAQINFSWGDASPMVGIVIPDGFSVRWFGQVEAPVSGNYTFKTNNDDGTRLWVGDQILINDWNGHAPTWQQGSIYLTAGQKYDIVIDFADFGGGAQAQLYWEYPGQNLQLIPSNRLYPQATATSIPIGNSIPTSPITFDDVQPICRLLIGCTVLEMTCYSHRVVDFYQTACSPDPSDPGNGGVPHTGGGGGFPSVPGGPTSPLKPKFIIKPLSTGILERARFYTNMRAIGISFTDEEAAVIDEYKLYDRVRSYVNQYGTKPDGSNTFILSLADQQRYPKFASLVRSLPDFVENDEKVKAALIQYTGYSYSKLKELLKYGQGPRIYLVDNLQDSYGHPILGLCDCDIMDKPSDSKIQIKENYVQGYEIDNGSLSRRRAGAFLLAVTVLHEFVHYSRNQNQLNDFSFEFGETFEVQAFGVRIGPDNAGKLSYKMTQIK